MVGSSGTLSIGQLFSIPPLGTIDYIYTHKLNIPRTVLSTEASWNRASHIHAIALFPPPTRVTSSKLPNRTTPWPVETPNCAWQLSGRVIVDPEPELHQRVFNRWLCSNGWECSLHDSNINAVISFFARNKWEFQGKSFLALCKYAQIYYSLVGIRL